MVKMYYFQHLLVYGKSVLYQLPCLLLEGTAVVISPLLALMDDQIQALTKKGIKAVTINSTIGIKEKREIFSQLKSGDVKLLYIAPETLLNEEIIDFINQHLNISYIAIDEAHCISNWRNIFQT